MKKSLTDEILKCLKDEKELSLSDLSRILRISSNRISPFLTYLVNTGKVKRKIKENSGNVIFYYYIK